MVYPGFPPPYGSCEHLRVKDVEETLDPFKASYDIFKGLGLTVQCHREVSANLTEAGVVDNSWMAMTVKFISDMVFFLGFITFYELAVVFGLAVVWTIARQIATDYCFKPYAKWFGVADKNVNKLAESAWKAGAFLVMWAYALKVTFSNGYDFFSKPMEQFADWTLDLPPADLSLVYALELSFYVHSIYATIYMDSWKKDSIVLMVHHFVSITLIAFSYTIRCIKIGVMIFVLNDIGDVLLEVGKVATCLRDRNKGRFRWLYSAISDVAAVIFVVTWVTNRLWCHLVKVWRAGSLGTWSSHPVLPLPFHIFLNMFLGTLYAFYIYWFYFIVIFISRVLRKDARVDPRDDDLARAAQSKKRK